MTENKYEGLYVALELLERVQSFGLSLNGEKVLAYALAGDDAYLQSVVGGYYGPRGEKIPEDIVAAHESRCCGCPCDYCGEEEDGPVAPEEPECDPTPNVQGREVQPGQALDFDVQQLTPEQINRLNEATTKLLRQFFPWMA